MKRIQKNALSSCGAMVMPKDTKVEFIKELEKNLQSFPARYNRSDCYRGMLASSNPIVVRFGNVNEISMILRYLVQERFVKKASDINLNGMFVFKSRREIPSTFLGGRLPPVREKSFKRIEE